MTIEGLGYINDCLKSLNIPYEFDEWKGEKTFPFFVGEYTDESPVTEDGHEESSFFLTGTNEGSYLPLMEVCELVKELFPTDAETTILESGSGIAVSFDGSNHIPSVDQNIKRIQINLHVEEWRVN